MITKFYTFHFKLYFLAQEVWKVAKSDTIEKFNEKNVNDVNELEEHPQTLQALFLPLTKIAEI